MAISSQACRLCLSVSEFNVSLFGSHCTKTNMVGKILVCLKIIIEKTDRQNTICYKCAENIERFYDFIAAVKKSQYIFEKQEYFTGRPPTFNTHITSYIREDADCTFSCMDLRRSDENRELKQSSPFFSYFGPPPALQISNENSRPRSQKMQLQNKHDDSLKRKSEKPKRLSGDIFESQTDFEDLDSSQWKLSPDRSLMKKIREKCFGRSDY